MPQTREEDEDYDERELPDESDMDDSDDPETIPCPYCGKDVSEEAERCPGCGNYLSREDAPQRPTKWVVLGGLVLLAAMLFAWLIRR